MIDKAKMMALLSQACPSFHPNTPRTSRYWKDEEEGVVEATVQEFGHHILGLIEVNQTQDVVAIFLAIERLHLEGNAFVREDAAPHLVDFLLWEERVGARAAEEVRRHLGPESS